MEEACSKSGRGHIDDIVFLKGEYWVGKPARSCKTMSEFEIGLLISARELAMDFNFCT